MQLEKLEIQERLEASLDGVNNTQTPKFQIKRKYLSFDYKGRDNLQGSGDFSMPYYLEKLKRVEERITLDNRLSKEVNESI